ncbi:hypothetical protein [Nitrolancea hollandica]|uniref:Uncharacterized protein n=1 Tax=Nitrolancea hollandica Lb TaxID=1129897 RepID=I4EMH6_9BACT|nr:hypothetical protein [Nitrolancea hollandica]CCF85889.1 hypothetical protein NITHO_6040003 [Nitrolancea hollandica Lb]
MTATYRLELTDDLRILWNNVGERQRAYRTLLALAEYWHVEGVIKGLKEDLREGRRAYHYHITPY